MHDNFQKYYLTSEQQHQNASLSTFCTLHSSHISETCHGNNCLAKTYTVAAWLKLNKTFQTTVQQVVIEFYQVVAHNYGKNIFKNTTVVFF